MGFAAIFRWLAIISMLFIAAGCTRHGNDDAKTRAVIADPQVGDIYAAELTYFSEADFENQPKIYGLLKVVESDAVYATVVTEDAGSDEAAVALQDIAGDLSGIGFDGDERIVISHADLMKAFESGKIMAAKRNR